MSINVNVAAYLRPYMDNKESAEVSGKTVKECLDDLVTRYPGLKKMFFTSEGKLHDYVSIYVGGEIFYSEMLDKLVKDGDTLHVLYVIGGG